MATAAPNAPLNAPPVPWAPPSPSTPVVAFAGPLAKVVTEGGPAVAAAVRPSMRPAPKTLSVPASPRSIALPVMIPRRLVRAAAAESAFGAPSCSRGCACMSSAASPATCGAEADVPKNFTFVGRNPPEPVTETPSVATTSGFVRPSSVGPCELKLSIVFGALWGTAPTVITSPSESACASSEPREVCHASPDERSPGMNSSRFRAAAVLLLFQMKMSYCFVLPVRLEKVTCSDGFAPPFCTVVLDPTSVRDSLPGAPSRRATARL